MFEDEIDDESNVEALVISWYYYAVLILLLHFAFLSKNLGQSYFCFCPTIAIVIRRKHQADS